MAVKLPHTKKDSAERGINTILLMAFAKFYVGE